MGPMSLSDEYSEAGLSLLAAAEAFQREEEDLTVAAHAALLRRRFNANHMQADALAAGLEGSAALTSSRSVLLARMQLSERCAGLQVELAEAKSEAEKHQKRAAALEEQVAILTSAMRQEQTTQPTSSSSSSSSMGVVNATLMPQSEPPLAVPASRETALSHIQVPGMSYPVGIASRALPVRSGTLPL